MRKLLATTVTGFLLAGCGVAAPKRSTTDIAKLTTAYLASHKTVSRTFRSGDQSVTLLTDGTEEDLTASLGDDFSGRVIKTKNATYFQMPLGKEVAPGIGPAATYKLWVDAAGRPVRLTLTAERSSELTFSAWETSHIQAPPAEQIRSLR
ncbi:hypothetical protein [Sphaerisporangium aureirubrum]|uniref:DUF4426 domain-containing protein n=1 Tax=Sphaerisporangium aureirubrum TaxID=1544736 RepID=A0ABW1NHI8_9ACTN